MQDNYNTTWVHLNLIQPYFGPKVGPKVIGERVIFWFLVPAVLNILVVLYLTASCLCKCICGSNNTQKSVGGAEKRVTKVEPQKQPAKPTPSEEP